ncbi:RNA polymerase sigma-70 factor, ECF subfamily [Catalinimonas alkaloidigena]|uniref:RNA polymerase sigma-70 factor, ECF subfamily n=1 Tax=Catalinimonas alkaloidigena TaxID=1075417 RepID=A0A1G9LME5_9BACT|nr:sigma-70 family RNA polymerase sigma factor [Catalinimonas alkaloidigena]SDL63081.1 RNA polymerase sigma-70 factor, ECF subfamily [Catalinimonas alkaloidigena]
MILTLPRTFQFQEATLPGEAQLIAEAKRNPARFEVLYNRHYETIFNYLYRRTSDEDLAADLTSQTFLKAMLNLGRYEYRGIPFLAWLYRIAGNEIKKHYRKSGQAQVFSLEVSSLAKWLPDEETADTEEKLQQLAGYLERLAEDEVLILQLRFFEEKSFQEIAYIMDIGESAAKMRVYRTLTKLKRFFER